MSTVVISSANRFFDTPADALVHVPHARSTFGDDITAAFHREFPEAAALWTSALQGLTLAAAVRVTHPGTRWVIHTAPMPEGAAVGHVTRVLDAVVAQVIAHAIRTLNLYAMPQYGLHGPLFAEFVRTAFQPTACTVTIFDGAHA